MLKAPKFATASVSLKKGTTRLIVLAAALSFVTLSPSSQGISQTLYVVGVGMDTCEEFTAHIAGLPGQSLSRTAPDDGQSYYSKSTTYLEWLLGYVTGYNAVAGDPQKQIKLDPAAIDLFVRNWCAENPTGTLFSAMHRLAALGAQP
jgi:hypothetical protein